MMSSICVFFEKYLLQRPFLKTGIFITELQEILVLYANPLLDV